MINHMGNFATGDKPKFDLVTASKTKKYKVITAVILILGLLLLGGGLLMKGLNTKTVVPNTLEINELSGLTNKNGQLTCNISIDQPFLINTGTVDGRALVEPITFTFLDGASQFLVVRDQNNSRQITKSYYPGLFYFGIRANAPEYVINAGGESVNPTGKVRITCGSFMKEIVFTYIPA